MLHQSQTKPRGGGLPFRWFVLFHASYWIAVTAYSYANSIMLGESPAELPQLLVVEGGGFVLTFFAWLALRELLVRRLALRVVAAALICVPCAFLYAVNLWAVYWGIEFTAGSIAPHFVRAPDSPFAAFSTATLIARLVFLNFWFIAAWAGFFLAFDYAARMRNQEAALARVRALAQEAQLKMLRFQLNPHLLFNSLNTISSLVLDRRNEAAEAMLIKLADFLRVTLDAEPTQLTTLAEELDVQRLYLDMERERFGERLRTTFDVPAALELCRVPSLILQPLVENAVKYSVAPSSSGGGVIISARTAAGDLEIVVQDDGLDETAGERNARPGPGVGLANTAQRLRELYGDAASLDAGPSANGGFQACLRLPFDCESAP